jgi:hypothetical protein
MRLHTKDQCGWVSLELAYYFFLLSHVVRGYDGWKNPNAPAEKAPYKQHLGQQAQTDPESSAHSCTREAGETSRGGKAWAHRHVHAARKQKRP